MNNYFTNSDYIGASGNFPINDYIDYTSNYLNTKIDNIDIETSNIASNISSNYTNNLRNELWDVNSNNGLCLIKYKNYSGIPHTYIINSNLNGEIRFNTKFSYSATSDPINDYAVKIDCFGKLYVYHKYNLLQPTFPAGWYDLEGEVLALKADGINTDAQLSALEIFQFNATQQITALQALTGVQQIEIFNLQEQVEMLGFVSGNQMYLIQGAQNFETLSFRFGEFANLISTNYADRLAVAATIGIGVGIPAILASAADYMNREYYYRLASNFSNPSLPSLTTEERRILYSCNDIPYLSNTSNYNYYTCNLGINQGFINCNLQTTQFIPTLKSNKIMLGNITTPNAAYQMEMTGDLNLNMLYLNSTSLTSLLNQKQGNLTFTQPLYNTTNTIGLNYDSSLTKIGNNLSVVKTASLPLAITGNNWALNYDSTLTLSGNNLSVASATASKWTQSGNNIYNNNSGNVGIGIANPTAKLHIVTIDGGTTNLLNFKNTSDYGIYADSSSIGSRGNTLDFKTKDYNSGTITTRDILTLRPEGNVGINTTNPSYKLHVEDGSVFIGDSAYTSAGLATANGYKLIFDNTYNGSSGSGNICNKLLLHNHSGFNAGFGIEESALVYQSGVKHRFYTGTTSSAYGFLSHDIGKDLFNFYGDLNGTSGGYIKNASAGVNAACFIGLTNDSGSFAGLFLNSSARAADGGVNTLTLRNDSGDLRLSAKSDSPYIYLKNSTGNVGINIITPSYKLDVNGSLNSTSLYIATRLIQTHLFNNTGRPHTTFTDFNTPTDFGCHFIQASTNGPGFNTQYYSMTLGLGSEYGDYRAQITIPRNVSNPYLCIRYMEGGNWNAWQRISAGLADNASSSTFSIRSPNENTSSILYLGTPFNSSSPSKCAIIAQAVSSYSRSKLHFCLNGTADNSSIYQAGLADGSFTFDYDGNMGLMNQSVPNIGGGDYALHLGNSAITTTSGNLIIHKRNNSGGTRLYRIGYDGYFWTTIGDYGNNNSLSSWIYQFSFPYNCPTNSCYLTGSGGMVIAGTLTQNSDQRIKTDIKTIENSLWKVQQLRGVEYTHIIEGTRHIGLIAQEVENIIPEVVFEGVKNDIKGVSYGNLVALLIEGIKDLKVINDRQQDAIENANVQINNLIKRIELLENK